MSFSDILVWRNASLGSIVAARLIQRHGTHRFQDVGRARIAFVENDVVVDKPTVEAWMNNGALPLIGPGVFNSSSNDLLRKTPVDAVVRELRLNRNTLIDEVAYNEVHGYRSSTELGSLLQVRFKMTAHDEHGKIVGWVIKAIDKLNRFLDDPTYTTSIPGLPANPWTLKEVLEGLISAAQWNNAEAIQWIRQEVSKTVRCESGKFTELGNIFDVMHNYIPQGDPKVYAEEVQRVINWFTAVLTDMYNLKIAQIEEGGGQDRPKKKHRPDHKRGHNRQDRSPTQNRRRQGEEQNWRQYVPQQASLGAQIHIVGELPDAETGSSSAAA